MDAHQWSQWASLNNIPDSLRLRVLVVESDTSSHYSISNLIKSCGYNCSLCLCARDTLQILRERDRKKPDIILIAIDLSDMSGLELLEIVMKEMGNFPVIMMASEDSQINLIKAFQLGACDYIVKPVNEVFVRKMSQHVIHTPLALPLSNNVGCGSSIGREDASTSTRRVFLQDAVHTSDEGKGKRIALEVGIGKSPTDFHSKKFVFSGGGAGNLKKKGRLTWTKDLKKEFETVVNEIGLENATANKVLDEMHGRGHKDLTRCHVASHLQIYRAVQGKASKCSSRVNEAQGSQPVRNEDDDCSSIAESIEGRELSCLTKVDEARDSKSGAGIDDGSSDINNYHCLITKTEIYEESRDETASTSTRQVTDTVKESLFTFDEAQDKDGESCDISNNPFLTKLHKALIGVMDQMSDGEKRSLQQEPLIFEASPKYVGYEASLLIGKKSRDYPKANPVKIAKNAQKSGASTTNATVSESEIRRNLWYPEDEDNVIFGFIRNPR